MIILYRYSLWLVVFNCLETYELMGRVIPYMKRKKMFQTTNQKQIEATNDFCGQCSCPQWRQSGNHVSSAEKLIRDVYQRPNLANLDHVKKNT